MLDLCSLFGYTNARNVEGVVGWVWDRQPELQDELAAAVPSMVATVKELHRNLSERGLRGDEDEDEGGEVGDQVQYLVDITATVHALSRSRADLVTPGSKVGRALLGAEGLLAELAAMYGQVRSSIRLVLLSMKVNRDRCFSLPLDIPGYIIIRLCMRVGTDGMVLCTSRCWMT